MKTAFAALLGLLLVQGMVFAGVDTNIPETNRVILASGDWKPSEEDTQRALNAIQTFLDKPTSTNAWELGEIKKILAHTKDYRVQFKGVLFDGRKLVFCNFFPVDRGEGFNYWKEHEVAVDDGGFAFWQIYFDPKTGECLKFMSNGDA
ncbi:MAG: hypothetical protein WCH84_10640 [Verrucomicrobiota bacterium]